MTKAPWATPIYDIAHEFRENALLGGRSVLTAEAGVWANGPAVDFHTRFVVNEDVSDNTFMDKLLTQLAGAPRETVLLAADLMALRFLGIHDMTRKGKLDRVQPILALLPDNPPVPDEIATAFEGGVAGIGQAKTQNWLQMRFLSELAVAWTAMSEPERRQALSEAKAWKDWLGTVPHPNLLEISALTNLFFPDEFEAIVSVPVKEKIVKSFGAVSGVSDADDLDDKLARLREELESILGQSFNFYDPLLKRIWSDPNPAAEEFAQFGIEFHQLPVFAAEEIDYKEAIAARLAVARTALETRDADWPHALRQAFSGQNNITDWRQHDTFLRWCEASPDEAGQALAGIWGEAEPDGDALRAFLEAVPASAIKTPGARANILSFLLLARDVDSHPAYKATASDGALQLCGLEPGDRSDPVGRYLKFVEFLDELRVRVVALGGPEMSRLEAQSVSWMVMTMEIPGEWPEERQEALRRFRGGEIEKTIDSDPIVGSSAILPGLASVTDSLAAAVHLPTSWLQELVNLLDEKMQMIFYGPPGTGKTLIAQALAEHLTAGGGQWRLVQFHPSYSYEDFFEGYRPIDVDGQLTYELRPGPLRRIAELARGDPSNPYILIVDEINRGNIPKIFGELLFLLEYRNRAIELQYSQTEFVLPPNLFLIGTMNTADRSIALVDAALRRRFYFQAFIPTEMPVRDVLRRWLQATGRGPLAADLLDELNGRLGKGEISIGPSYFMSNDGGELQLERVWGHAIMPLLEEHFYSSKHEVEKEFGFAACRAAVKAAAASEPPAGVDGERTEPDSDLPDEAPGAERPDDE